MVRLYGVKDIKHEDTIEKLLIPLYGWSLDALRELFKHNNQEFTIYNHSNGIRYITFTKNYKLEVTSPEITIETPIYYVDDITKIPDDAVYIYAPKLAELLEYVNTHIIIEKVCNLNITNIPLGIDELRYINKLLPEISNIFKFIR